MRSIEVEEECRLVSFAARLPGQRGQGTVEYVGLILLVRY